MDYLEDEDGFRTENVEVIRSDMVFVAVIMEEQDLPDFESRSTLPQISMNRLCR
jgi:hypothetical protein